MDYVQHSYQWMSARGLWTCATHPKILSSTEDFTLYLLDNNRYYILWASQLWLNDHCLHLHRATSMDSRLTPQKTILSCQSKRFNLCSRPSRQRASTYGKSDAKQIKQPRWEILSHPPFSPDISLSDYLLFLSLDNHMRDRKFKNREELEKKLNNFFAFKDRDFFRLSLNWSRDIGT